jgi:hypothetical protein
MCIQVFPATMEFLGLWEKLSNPGFKTLDSRGLKRKQAATILFFLLRSG